MYNVFPLFSQFVLNTINIGMSGGRVLFPKCWEKTLSNVI
jgi:hypothetical protein